MAAVKTAFLFITYVEKKKSVLGKGAPILHYPTMQYNKLTS